MCQSSGRDSNDWTHSSSGSKIDNEIVERRRWAGEAHPPCPVCVGFDGVPGDLQGVLQPHCRHGERPP
eukprot:scaffold438748_cov17-Prasinocladus_malaysianus.AAC.1